MKLLFCLSFIYLLLILVGCRGKPELVRKQDTQIDFTAQAIPSTDYPIPVRFSTKGDTTNTYHWAISNGQTTSGPVSTLTFLQSGVYQATLTKQSASVPVSLTKNFAVPFRQYSVAMIYLIPKEGSFNPFLFAAIKQLSPSVQHWYANQLGKTFRVNDPLADTLQSSRYSYQYGQSSIDFLKSIEAEVSRKLESRLNKNRQVVLIFYPIVTNGFEGVGTVYNKDGEEKRIGVISGRACQSLTAASDLERNLGLWTTAHELGHTLGLSHNVMLNSLMFGPVDNTGYLPDGARPQFSTCFLTETDRISLRSSLYLY